MREKIEQNQVIIYLITIIIAVFIGVNIQNIESLIDWLPIILAILMYSMFLQIPFNQLKQSFTNRRFMIALMISNYIVVPSLVALLILFLPADSAIIFGVLLVLLTPCIDYVIVFTQIGNGDAKLMLASTPLLFITQLLLLPIYIWLFMGKNFLSTLSITPFVESFLYLIILPFIFALVVQNLFTKSSTIDTIHQISNWLPVPFMALVLFIIIASQISHLLLNQQLLLQVIPIYVAFMALMMPLNILIGKIFQLNSTDKRTLIYSAGTRNSLAVLPFALALPKDMAIIATTVIVTQTIIELLGELVYVKITPKIK